MYVASSYSPCTNTEICQIFTAVLAMPFFGCVSWLPVCLRKVLHMHITSDNFHRKIHLPSTSLIYPRPRRYTHVRPRRKIINW